MAPKPSKSHTAIGIRKEAGGWVLVELTYLDNKIIKEKLSVPDYRDITLEKFMRATSIFWGLDE